MRDDIKEYNAVENVAKKFCEAVKTGKAKLLNRIFMSVLASLDN